MIKYNFLKDYRSILCLNGSLPEAGFFANNLPIIAADGAANQLALLGIKPSVIIGDLDSIRLEDYNKLLAKSIYAKKFLGEMSTAEYIDIFEERKQVSKPKSATEIRVCKKFNGIEIIQILDQNKSDFQKALEYAEKTDLFPTIVTGISGGFLDHILNNINIILEKDCTFFAPPILGYVLKAPCTFNTTLPILTKTSLFGISRAIITSNGLKWDLNDQLLEFPGFNSSLNRTASENISIQVTEGNLLLLIYIEDIQDRGCSQHKIF